MWYDQNTCKLFDRLERQSPLAVEVRTTPVASVEQLRMSRFRLRSRPSAPATLRSTSDAARPISSSARWSNSVRDSSTCLLTRLTSAKRSCLISSRKGISAFSWSHVVASGRVAAVGITVNGSVGEKLPSSPGS